MTATSSDPGLPIQPTPDISVVLPVFNEADHIVEEVERIRRGLSASPYSYEIIVVDDGSTDDGISRLSAVTGVRIVRFHENRGSGEARKAGTQAARGRVVVWSDADMTYPNDQIAGLVDELHGEDQVVGARDAERGSQRAIRVPAKWLIRRLASYLFRKKIPDLNSGFRAFRRDVGVQFLNQLPRGFSCVSTMTLTFLANGYSVKHVPIRYSVRSGRSKFHWWSDTNRYLMQVVRIILSYEPLRIFLPIGTWLALVGVIKLGYDLLTKGFRVPTNTLLVVFAAFQILSIGLLADLVVRLMKRKDLVPPAVLNAVQQQGADFSHDHSAS